MRIALAGSGKLAACMLRSLLMSQHEIVAVLQNGRKLGKFKRWGMRVTASFLGSSFTVMGMAARNRIPILWLDKMSSEELAPLRELNPDVIFVGGFGIIFKEPILKVPRIGCVNMHSSLLPRHRGPNPFSAAILSGDTETGITFHVMDTGIDTGDILEQYSYPITEEDTVISVYENACELAAAQVVAVMDRIEKQGLQGTPQDASLASYDSKMEDKDAYVNWGSPAREIFRLLRATRPFILPRFTFRTHTVYISRLTFDETPVNAAPGTILAIRPRPIIATGKGTVTLETAYLKKPIPASWPVRWSCPEVGEKLP